MFLQGENKFYKKAKILLWIFVQFLSISVFVPLAKIGSVRLETKTQNATWAISFKMASDENEVKLEEKCKEMGSEGIRKLDDNLPENVNNEEDTRLFEKNKDETKDANLSESESENFEDAVEEITEKLNNEDIKQNSLDEDNEKNVEHDEDEDAYLEPSEPLTEEQILVRFAQTFISAVSLHRVI